MSLNRQKVAQGEDLEGDGDKLQESAHLPNLASDYTTVSIATAWQSCRLSFDQK